MHFEPNTILDCLRTGVETLCVEDTQDVAQALAEVLPENCTLALYGDLGSGKTAFIAGLAKAWDISEVVSSPTFAIMNIYKGTRTLMHIDAYRITNAEQFDALGIEEWLTPPFCLAIEWPENAGVSLPNNAWKLHFRITSKHTHLIQLAHRV